MDGIVKMVELPRMRVVSFHVMESESPEEEAWARLKSWAEPRRLFDNPTVHQVFGRNNPILPDKDGLRGYEFWMTIPDAFPAEDDASVTCFPGGFYAVMTSRGIEQMQANFKRLLDWVGNHPVYSFGYPEGYDPANQPSLDLEHHIVPDAECEMPFLIDYYFPVYRRQKA